MSTSNFNKKSNVIFSLFITLYIIIYTSINKYYILTYPTPTKFEGVNASPMNSLPQEAIDIHSYKILITF